MLIYKYSACDYVNSVIYEPNLHSAATAFKETDHFQYQNDEQFDKTLDTSIALYFYNNKAKQTHTTSTSV